MNGSRRDHARRQASRSGVLLLGALIVLFVALAVTGLGVDLARLALAQSALQSRLDAVALAAVLELDGTAEGQAHARGRVTAAELAFHPESPVVSAGIEFASSASGPWLSEPAPQAEIRAVRLKALARLKLGMVQGLIDRRFVEVAARSIAEQRQLTSVPSGLFPYSPIAHSTNRPDFGFRRHERYTLRWALSPSPASGNVCAGDQTPEALALHELEKFRPVGLIEALSPGAIRRAILNDEQSFERAVGSVVEMAPGDPDAERASVVERVRQDTDSASETYSIYSAGRGGNGRRLVAVPVHSPARNGEVSGFAAFFLLTERHYSSAGQPLCAEFAGSFLAGATHAGAPASGFFTAVVAH